MNVEIEEVLHLQAGVISRRQLLAAGVHQHDIRRLLRRNVWARMHHGVYINHTGPPDWFQRAWAAVLHAHPAALYLDSALRAAEGPTKVLGDESATIHVAVSRQRAMLTEPDGVRIHHLSDLESRVLWNVGPPRMRYEDAALDVACRAASEADAVAVLATACQNRRTTAQRLLGCLDSRRRIANRRWLRAVLTDIADGTCSVLEHGYLTKVERPHGLPRAVRQRRSVSTTVCYRDVEYGERLVVELDGRAGHDSTAARDADFERDLDAAVDGRSTIRLCYRQVFDRPCRTAAKIARVLHRHGIPVRGRSCGPGCEFRIRCAA